MKVEIKYVGHHKPYGDICEVDKEEAAVMVESGDFEYVKCTSKRIKKSNKTFREKPSKEIISTESVNS